MKKFSTITGQKVAEQPKNEIKITEADIFKSKVMTLMDDFLKVQMIGPITRYHVAGTMKVVGKELFLEALMDLLDQKSNGEKIKLLESLKNKITNWQVIDESIDELQNTPTGLYKHKVSIKNLYEKYKSDSNLLFEQTKNSANKLKDVDKLTQRITACKSLSQDLNFNSELLSEMRKIYQKKIDSLQS
jgi:hypothetical protein